MGCVKKDQKVLSVEAAASSAAPADDEAAAAEAAERKQRKKEKRRRQQEAEAEVEAEAGDEQAAAAEAAEAAERKQKKKEEKRKRKAAAAETAAAAEAEAEEEAAPQEQPKKKKKKSADPAGTATTTASSAPAKTTKFKDHSSHPFYKENNVSVADVPAPQPATTFAESMLGSTITSYLQEKFKGGVPSPIQSVSWPLIMQGHDVFGIAKTGSGKTLAFILPFLARSESGPVAATKKNQPRLVCMAPTKELVQQIAAVGTEFANILGGDKYPVQCIIGGMPKWEQKDSINRKGCQICVASPGRLLDLVENDGALDLSKTECLVLDEADRMLDDGFIMTMRKISEFCERPGRQTVLFSATWPLEVSKLATGLICQEASMQPATITVMRPGESAFDKDGDINTEDKLQLNDAIKQEVHVLKDWKQKWDLLTRHLDTHSKKKIIVFGLVKKEVANLENWMNAGKYKCKAIQGDMTQPARNAALDDFKENRVRILVATDVAARGLDIPDVDVVINYTFPLTCEDWVHRTGRTGRAGKTGLAITFFNENGEFNEVNHCFDIIRLLEAGKQAVPPALRTLDSKTFTATKKKGHALYGNFFKSPELMAKLEKKKVHVTFDNSDSE